MTGAFVVVLSIFVAIRFVLAARQIGCVRAHRDAVPAAFAGRITEAQAHIDLEKIQVRGGFGPDGYTGYDYRNQRWVQYARRPPA